MSKYFPNYEYDDNLQAGLAIYQLQGKSIMWWEEVKIVWNINEKEASWENSKNSLERNI